MAAISPLARIAIIADLTDRFPTQAREHGSEALFSAWLVYEQSDEYGQGDGDVNFPAWIG